MGGGGVEIQQPNQPSTADAVNAWVASLPTVYKTQMEYAPKEAAQQVALAQQYAAPLGQALLTAQKEMYPNEYALSDSLTQQAQQGMTGEMPEWAKQSYLDTMRGQLGDNALSGSGADYMSRGLLQQQEDWKRYYQNLGLSISGKQPIYGANTPQTSNYMAGFTPNANMNYMANTYGTAGQIYGSQLSNQQSSPWMNMLGSIGGSAAGGMFGFGGMFGQSLR